MQFIDLKSQYKKIQNSVKSGIDKVLENGQFILGPEILELEEKLAQFTGVKHCITLSSGTDALLIALLVLDIKPGDEVITSPFTFIASAEPIALLSAQPVFVDIDARSYNIDPEKIEKAITSKTRAIVPVSLYGQCADYDEINVIAQKYNLPVIEDGAQSFGAIYKGKRSCSITTIGVTSFFPSKPLGCYGDGGACFTNDDSIAQTVRQIRVHGQSRRYVHEKIGVNGRMDTIQAAILIEKFKIFPDEIELRNKVANRYSRKFSENLNGRIIVPHIKTDKTSVFAQYTILVENRDKVASRLKEKGIPTAVHYPIPLHLQPAFNFLGYAKGDFPVAENIAEKVLSLPMHPYLTELDQDKIIAELGKIA